MAKRTFKVRKEISGSATNFRKWDEWKVGDTFIGEFKKMKMDPKYDKPTWTFLVEEAMFVGKPKAAAALAGKNLTLNSNGKLDKAMAEVEPGQFVEIEYMGKKRMEGGKYKGKEAHDVKVMLLSDDDEGADMDEEEDEVEESDDEDLDL